MNNKHAVDWFDATILQKYDRHGPRYTSYPTALEFNSEFKNFDFESALRTNVAGGLSLYFHLPFCHSLCYYCGCNKIVTRHPEKADQYLDALIQEMAFRSSQVGKRAVSQIHLGGGTPSFLSEAQLSRLMFWVNRLFNVKADAQISIEIDPRRIAVDYIDCLSELGFTRLSIGVQDTSANVQRAINREQSTSFIKKLIQRAHQLQMNSVNIDLIYGLPHQTLASYASTMKEVQCLNADRISLFSYAHLPHRFAAQRKIKDTWLPSSALKLQLMRMATEHFLNAGYEIIGMDHFAKPDDELAIAQREGRLHRNFQGYTVSDDMDVLGMGVSAISSIGNIYSQNCKELSGYYEAMENQGHAVEKGRVLTDDDLVRRFVIKELMCNLKVDKKAVETRYDINFDVYFADAIHALAPLVAEQLIENDDDFLVVKNRARLIIRSICMAFDAYLPGERQPMRYSRII